MASGPVEDHLLVECAVWNGRSELMVATPEGFDPRTHFEAQLEALEAIGALDSGEKETWLRRFEEAAAPDEPLEPDEALRKRVDRYLETLMPSDPFDREAARTLATTLDLLENLEILSADDAKSWRERSWRGQLDEDEEDDEYDEPSLRCRTLSRVLLGPEDEVDGIRVVSLELYDDGVLVRWSAPPQPDGWAGEEIEPTFDLADDAGTTYELLSSGWDSNNTSRARGETEFSPAAPAGVVRLRLTVGGRELELELDA